MCALYKFNTLLLYWVQKLIYNICCKLSQRNNLALLMLKLTLFQVIPQGLINMSYRNTPPSSQIWGDRQFSCDEKHSFHCQALLSHRMLNEKSIQLDSQLEMAFSLVDYFVSNIYPFSATENSRILPLIHEAE